ncbi:nucleotidyltransferase domain-containing protein [Halobacillus yeomjeoni]|uniref:nucleotidyltransferase domain-containing protein n=1 Tax=Halobacillus yeomjeoni TaxID=311194 RepID=UPI001CD45402|nr:nucleotidyltransferase domain-containing protein [Halobacillus yeomjeoni]MCA0984963.1 nucleotidyltransferase domain-containing protein [Halobacillus yeomjeoni]
MSKRKKLPPVDAATEFVKKHHPDCQAALLAGSVIRRESTETSDLDIVIFDERFKTSYRESLVEFGWPIEVFVHNSTSYTKFFNEDKERARPSMPRMVMEGKILKGESFLAPIKKEAEELIKEGPKRWSEEEIKMKRYFITDALDDFIGCKNRAEGLFIASSLMSLACEFVLRTNNQWVGSSKWMMRTLKEYDSRFANHFIQTFESYYKLNDKEKIITLVDRVLEPYGGRLFDGFSIGKE